MTELTPDILDRPITGIHLRGATLGEQLRLGTPVTLMVFLRHYGCIFCREMVRDLKSARDEVPNYPDLLFVGQGDVEETRAFADKLWPEMAILSDPDRQLFSAMGLGKGSIYQMFGPRVWACGVRAGLKGNFQGKIVGDPWTMPGVFAVDRAGQIRWQHRFDHAGDHPNWKTLPTRIDAAHAPAVATT